MTLPLDGVCIAFDLDGTLVDSAPDLIGALNEILAEHGLARTDLAAARRLVGRGARHLLDHGFAEAGHPFPDGPPHALTARFLALYRDRIADESRPYSGVETTLDRLIDDGGNLCVCTNKPTDLALALLNAFDLTRRFTAIVGRDQVSARKPDPAHLIEAVGLARGDLSRSLLVGDSDVDAAAAKAARRPFIFVTYGYCDLDPGAFDADQRIDRFDAVPEAIFRLCGGPDPRPDA